MFPQLEKLSVIGCEKTTALSGQENVCPKLSTKAKSPKLSVFKMQGSEEEMFLWVPTHMTSLTNLTLRRHDDSETTSVAADHSLTQVVGVMEKWNRDDFPLANMELIGFRLGVTELCACFVQIQRLCIKDSAALVHRPEKEFRSLVSLRSLKIISCEQLVGYAQAPVAEPSTASESSSELLPRLEYLNIYGCKSMVEIFKVPASLRKMRITCCSKLKFIFSSRPQQESQCH